MTLHQSLINRKRAESATGPNITLKNLRELVSSSNGLSDETFVYVRGVSESLTYKNWKQITGIMIEQFIKEE